MGNIQILAEPIIAVKPAAMLRLPPTRAAALLLGSLALAAATGCRPQSEGDPKIVVIGNTSPRLADPAVGPLSQPDAVLLQNVAQGLVAFDAGGNIVGGLAERWNVSDDGLSYIFRLASTKWDDGRKVNADQVARALRRVIASRRNPLSDTLGAVTEVVSMTDRVVEIRLAAPRPNLLAILAQPEFAILRSGHGAGPFAIDKNPRNDSFVHLTRKVALGDDEEERRDEVLLTSARSAEAIATFVNGRADVVLGGTFVDLPMTQRVKLARGALRFDPVSGLFGLVPVRKDGDFDSAPLRRLLSEAIDRDAFVSALGVPGLTPRATVLEPGLDGMGAPVGPSWTGIAIGERRASLAARASPLLPAGQAGKRPVVRIFLPDGPGATLLLQELSVDWGALGLDVERATTRSAADFALVDRVAPSASPAWFARNFRCTPIVPVCNPKVDELLDAARQATVAAQRYALIGQAAALIDSDQLMIPLTAPVRWSLVSDRIFGFSGNRFAVHTLTNLADKPAAGTGAQ